MAESRQNPGPNHRPSNYTDSPYKARNWKSCLFPCSFLFISWGTHCEQSFSKDSHLWQWTSPRWWPCVSLIQSFCPVVRVPGELGVVHKCRQHSLVCSLPGLQRKIQPIEILESTLCSWFLNVFLFEFWVNVTSEKCLLIIPTSILSQCRIKAGLNKQWDKTFSLQIIYCYCCPFFPL